MNTLENRLNQEVNIYRLVYDDNNKADYNQIGTAKAYIYMLNPEQALQVEGVYTKTYRMIVDRNIDIAIGDKITDKNGQEYRVKAVDDKIDRNGNIHHKEIILELP